MHSYKPTVKTHYDARIAKAEADYDVARERCDDLAGNKKDVCVKEAKAASGKASEARKDAAEDKSDARYQVEKEKCDQFSGAAKDQCQDQAKARFAK